MGGPEAIQKGKVPSHSLGWNPLMKMLGHPGKKSLGRFNIERRGKLSGQLETHHQAESWITFGRKTFCKRGTLYE